MLLNIYRHGNIGVDEIINTIADGKKNKHIFYVINCTCSNFRKRTKHNI